MLGPEVAYRLFDFSSDVGVEAEAETPEAALVDLARGVAHVLTDGSRVRARDTVRVDVEGAKDLAGTAIAFLNEVVYRFDAEGFLVAGGALSLSKDADVSRVAGTLRGEPFDPRRHRSGRGVKAATLHDASHEVRGGRHVFRAILDL